MNLNRRGEIIVHPACVPLVSVSSVKYRTLPSQSYITVTLGDFLDTYAKRFVVRDLSTLTIGLDPSVGTISAFDYRTAHDMSALMRVPITLQFAYIGGYPITQLQSSALAGATSIVVKDASGIVAGQTLALYDGASTERVTVAAEYTSGTTVGVSALTYAHNANVDVLGLPDSLVRATILYATALIKQRGSVSITPDGTPSTLGGNPLDKSDAEMAKSLCSRYKRVIVT